MYAYPSEEAIKKVMQETGMGRMQAINHLRGRELAREANSRRAAMFPRGKTAAMPEM